jgi:hypothetical protein
MTKLATTTLSTSAASVTFSNIPQHFTDLVVNLSTRTTYGSSGRDYIVFSFNSSTSVYSRTWLAGFDSSSKTSSTFTSETYGGIATTSGGAATASTFGDTRMYIPNYSGNNNKSYSVDATAENNSATTWMLNLAGGLWSNTSPITSITFYAAGDSISSPNANFAQHSTFTLYGIKNARQTAGNSIKATGGNISFDGTYVYHVFNSTGAFVPSQPLTADVLVVAGGGGAGSYFGAGGGGGGVLEFALQSLSSGNSYTCTVGAGATGVVTNIPGNNGSNSQFGSLTETIGGGGGGGGISGGNGKNGGSGGGGGQTGTAGTGTVGQGNNGYTYNLSQRAGGGGGAGAAATDANGGIGRTSGLINSIGSIGAGETVSGNTYFAGGGGGAPASATYGTGGFGGGGSAASGKPNTGGGGGSDQSAGGSGIIVVRYKG